MINFVTSDLYIHKTLKILLGLILFIPLLALAGLLNPYTAPKGILFRVLIEIAAFLYLYLVFKKSSLVSPPFGKGRLARLAEAFGVARGRILTFAVLIFLLAALISAVFGVDFSKSFWGTLDRMIGVWGLLHFILFFFLLIAVFKDEKDWQKLIKISVGASALTSLLGIGQRFFSISQLLPETERVFSTIGNAGILASYLIFNIFFTAYFLAQSKEFYRLIYGAAMLLQVGVLILTGTRGAVLGLAAGIICLLLLFGIFYPKKEKRKFFLAGLAVIILAAASFLVFKGSPFFQRIPVLERFADISVGETTAQNRLILWQNSWEALKSRPVFGWGPENFDLAINKYFDFRLNPYESWYDRAHNLIFDYGVSGGFFGLAAYLFLIAAIFLVLSKLIRRQMVFAAVFMSLFVAYLVQNFFIFDSFVSFLLFFFALAIISFFAKQTESAGNQISGKAFGLGAGKKVLLGFAALTLFFLVYLLNVKPLLASALAQKTFNSGSLSEYNEKLQRLVGPKNTYSDEIVYQANIDYLSKINSDAALTQDENAFKILSPALEDLIEKQPLQSNYHTSLGWLNLFFSGGDKKRAERALQLAQESIKLSPGKRDPYFISLGAYSVLGENKKAAEFLNSIKQKLPEDLIVDLEKYYTSLFN